MRSVDGLLLRAAFAIIATGFGGWFGGAEGQARHLTGVVRDSLNREGLPNATVTLPESPLRAVTDQYGRFILLNVPAGAHVLKVESLGYRARDVMLAEVPSEPLTILLAPDAIEVEGVRVETSTDLVRPGSRASVLEISPRKLSNLPTIGETDVFRALQLMPGVSGTGDASSGLYVRGGTPDENLVLLDGMTVYHVDHFFGFFSAFNPDAVKDIRLTKGGFPAKYGGRTSSVVEMVGKSGDNQRFSWSSGLNPLSGRAVTEVPLGGNGSWLLSLRRSYTDLIRTGLYTSIFDAVGGTDDEAAGNTGRGGTGTTMNGGQGPRRQSVVPDFYFYDLNSKVTYTPTDADVLSLSFYAGRDNLDQSESNSIGGFRIGPGGQQGAADSELVDESRWGNLGVSGRWSRTWTPRFTSEVLGAFSKYYSEGRRGTESEGLSFGFREDNEVRDAHLRLDNEWRPVQSTTFGFGAELTRNRVAYTFSQLQGDSVRGALDLGGEGALSAAYAQLRWNPSRRLEVTAGLRGTAYDRTRTTYVEPRVAANVLLTDNVKVKTAWGRYSQFVKRIENENIQQGSRDFWVLAGDTLPVAEAEHRIVGASWENDDYLFDVEAYDKPLDGVSQFSTRARTNPDQDLTEFFFSGTGRARGVELLAQRKAGRLTGWLSYTLAEVEYELDGFNGGEPFPASQDQRHEVKAVASYQLGKWVLASTAVYGSGKPYTLPEAQYAIETLDGEGVSLIHVGAKNAARLPAYHRVDVSATRRFETDRLFWELNLSVFNLYGRTNVWYRAFDLSQSPLVVTDVGTLGFTPSVSLRVGLR